MRKATSTPTPTGDMSTLSHLRFAHYLRQERTSGSWCLQGLRPPVLDRRVRYRLVALDDVD